MGVLSKGKAKAKGQKKKNPNQQKDFAKVKNKVGKKKKAASNDTKIDYKVKKVQMPSQNALDEKGDEVTHRRLGLLELLSHLQHHSGRVRRDAFHGLHELCSEHDGVLRTNLARILDATALAPTDASGEVRSAFRTFQAWLLQAMPRDAVSAFASTLALQVRSALSHVSGEIREDGLKLLELYLARLGSEQVLSEDESTRVVETLCQLNSHADSVLPCLHRLLQPARHTQCSLDVVAGIACQQEELPPQMSLQEVMDGRLRSSGSNDLAEGSATESQVWAFCLRAWMQAGDLPRGSAGRGSEAASRPGWAKLRAAAVLERALEGTMFGASLSVGSYLLQPSASQVATLSGIVRRGEWPLKVDTSSPYRALADSINLRMARAVALLVAGGAPSDAAAKHLERLAAAALSVVHEVAERVSRQADASAGRVDVASEAASLAAASAQGDELDNEVNLLTATSSVSYALRSLDLLWACVAKESERGMFGRDDVARLAEVTVLLASGGSSAEDFKPTAAVLLAVPLTASLLGLRPSAASAAATPPALRAGWPEALSRLGEPCLSDALEEAHPGTAASWVHAWPKLLWHLGGSEPQLSAFLLALVLELAKRAAKPGGLHEKLLSGTLPMLVPFLAGLPGSPRDHPPPLTKLPSGPGSPQAMAAAVLPHFPRLSEALIGALSGLLCCWSEAGVGAPDAPHLGADCCEVILEALLRGSQVQGSRNGLLPRLRAASSVLQVLPRSSPPSAEFAVRAERSALRMADAIAGWLMEEMNIVSPHPGEESVMCSAVHGHSLDDRRRLVLESVAWPLCVQLVESNADLSPRVLCFFFFCAVRLPSSPTEAQRPVDGSWSKLLGSVFDTFAVRGTARGLRSVSAGPSRGVGAAGALDVPACDTARGGGPSSRQTSDAPDGRHLAQIFVTAWMCAVAQWQRPRAYELLAKLCAQHILDPGADEAELAGAALAARTWLLSAAVAQRNAKSFDTSTWGSTEFGNAVNSSLAQMSADELRAQLHDFASKNASKWDKETAALEHLLAALPLL